MHEVFYYFIIDFIIIMWYYIIFNIMRRYVMDKKGFFIAIDGTDGSGKGTQSKLLCQALENMGVEYRYIDFPTYDPQWSSLVNMYLGGTFGDDPAAVNCYAASSFFGMDRYCSYMLDWRKDYLAGKVIVANRYTTANAVHQLAKLKPKDYDAFLEWLFDFEQNKLGLPMPDMVFYLSMPPCLSEKLVEKRCIENNIKKDIHEKNHAHLTAATKAAHYACQKLGWRLVDCNDGDNIRTIDDIHGEIVGLVKQELAAAGRI